MRVLITGISQGIGKTLARDLALQGHEVFGFSRSRPDDLESMRWSAVDVTRPDSILQGMVSLGLDREPCDVLVCCAGVGLIASAEECSEESARRVMDTNYFGVVNSVQAVLPGLRRLGRGKIVMVGSIAGRVSLPYQSHYSASKAALAAFGLCLKSELHALNRTLGTALDVTVVEPGDIRTAFNQTMPKTTREGSPYEARVESCHQVAIRDMNAAPGPELVSRLILKLLGQKRLRPRYVCGPYSGLVSFSQRALPEEGHLWLIRDHFGLNH